MNELVKSLKKSGFIFDKSVLKKPYSIYIDSGSLGEKAFELNCKRNNIKYIKAEWLLSHIFRYYCYEDKNGFLAKVLTEAKKYEADAFKNKWFPQFVKKLDKYIEKYDVLELVKILSKKQLNFLYKNFILHEEDRTVR